MKQITKGKRQKTEDIFNAPRTKSAEDKELAESAKKTKFKK